MPTKKKPEPTPVSPEVRRWAAEAMVDGTACAAVTARSLAGIGNGAADVCDLRCFIADTERCICRRSVGA